MEFGLHTHKIAKLLSYIYLLYKFYFFFKNPVK